MRSIIIVFTAFLITMSVTKATCAFERDISDYIEKLKSRIAILEAERTKQYSNFLLHSSNTERSIKTMGEIMSLLNSLSLKNNQQSLSCQSTLTVENLHSCENSTLSVIQGITDAIILSDIYELRVNNDSDKDKKNNEILSKLQNELSSLKDVNTAFEKNIHNQIHRKEIQKEISAVSELSKESIMLAKCETANLRIQALLNKYQTYFESVSVYEYPNLLFANVVISDAIDEFTAMLPNCDKLSETLFSSLKIKHEKLKNKLSDTRKNDYVIRKCKELQDYDYFDEELSIDCIKADYSDDFVFYLKFISEHSQE